MTKDIKVFEANEGRKKQDPESPKSEVEVKGKIIGDKKPIQNQMEIMRRSFIMNNTIDVVFSDLKKNLKNESNSSALVELSDEITKETSGATMREKQEKFECAIGTNFRTDLIVNDDTEKNNLLQLNKKVDEQEKALSDFLKLQ